MGWGFMFPPHSLARGARERSVSPEELLCGTEAWQSCLALLPVAWNVSKPARETKTQCRSFPRPRQGAWLGRGSPCMSIIPGDELFSGVVTSEPHFSSLPFFLFLFF